MKLPFLAFAVVAPLALTGATSIARAADAAKPDAIRIVPCDQPVKSTKRGVCLNEGSAADFMALSPSVSWWYSWFYKDTQNPPAAANMEFLPMAWGKRQEDLDGLKEYLKTHTPSHVLTLNEPNLKGQAFITPKESAEFYKQVKAVTDAHNIPLVGPHMSLGSAEGDSITAYDPIEKKDVTYTFMVPYLKAFMNYVGDTEVPAVAAHTYGNGGELNWMTGMMHDEFKRDVWITEFAQWNAGSADEEIDYMIQSVDLFERTPYVKGYAWFKERVNDNNKLSLLGKSGELTPLGKAYVQMPTHDPNVFYALPGRLQAQSYLTATKAEVTRTKDGDGFLEMQVSGTDNALDYNVFTEKAGSFPLGIRFKAAQGTKIDISANGKVLASVEAREDSWQTAQTTVELPKGQQTLRVHASGWTHLNWMEFGGK